MPHLCHVFCLATITYAWPCYKNVKAMRSKDLLEVVRTAFESSINKTLFVATEQLQVGFGSRPENFRRAFCLQRGGHRRPSYKYFLGISKLLLFGIEPVALYCCLIRRIHLPVWENEGISIAQSTLAVRKVFDRMCWVEAYSCTIASSLIQLLIFQTSIRVESGAFVCW